MSITVRKNFVRLRDIEMVTAADMRDVGELVVQRIRERTMRGQDADGGAFADYSDGYATAKRMAVGTSRVNLTVSGEMLNAMTVIDATPTKVTVGFKR